MLTPSKTDWQERVSNRFNDRKDDTRCVSTLHPMWIRLIQVFFFVCEIIVYDICWVEGNEINVCQINGKIDLSAGNHLFLFCSWLSGIRLETQIRNLRHPSKFRHCLISLQMAPVPKCQSDPVTKSTHLSHVQNYFLFSLSSSASISTVWYIFNECLKASDRMSLVRFL